MISWPSLSQYCGCHSQNLIPLEQRGLLRVMFIITSMPVGGAETLLVNLARRLDRKQFLPEVCCLKQKGPLGEALSADIPVYSRLLTHKFDLRVAPRLARLLAWRQIDAVITVGAGDKMFWGRIAAHFARTPVVLSALHATGWPDSVGRLNRWLTPWTDAFIGVADSHGRHLVEREHFPANKVRVIPNGVDVNRFRHENAIRVKMRQQWGVHEGAPVCGIVAALRPEKNHELFLAAAAKTLKAIPEARFVLVGDGPCRAHLESLASRLGLCGAVHFLGSHDDVPACLAAMDLFALTSHNEANPVSILEAMAAELPVVATDVGSVAESVRHGITGFLVSPGDANAVAASWIELMNDAAARRQFGQAARQQVLANWSLEKMVSGYEKLIAEVYQTKSSLCAKGHAAEKPAQ